MLYYYHQKIWRYHEECKLDKNSRTKNFQRVVEISSVAMKQNLDGFSNKNRKGYSLCNVYRSPMCTLAEVLYFRDRHEKKAIGPSGPIIGFLCSKLSKYRKACMLPNILHEINISMHSTCENKNIMTL